MAPSSMTLEDVSRSNQETICFLCEYYSPLNVCLRQRPPTTVSQMFQMRFLRRWRFALWVLALYSHRLRSVNGNRPSQWEMANFDPPPYRIETPELIATKFGITDYVLEGSLTQIWYKSIRWALLSIWVKYNVFVLFVHIFFWDSAYRSDPLMNFYAR